MSRAIKVLHFSTHNEDCGIGKYQEMFLDEMKTETSVHNDFFELSPNQIKIMNKPNYSNAFDLLERTLKDYDILHMQHEYSFYWNDELERAVDIARRLGKKIIVTVHASANVAHKKAKLSGLGPRSFAHYARGLVSEKWFFKRFIDPLKKVDLIIVHNEVTKVSLTSRGVPSAIITKIVIPVPEVNFELKSNEIHEKLEVKSGDIVYATVGFLHKYKGVQQAIKALRYLPGNYKLAIIGGLHSGTDDVAIYDKITDLIADLGLKDRVYITGYVADDGRMNALIRECDVCVYPYDKDYYSNVSSAALNNALANNTPVVAYPTESFKEINSLQDVLCLTQTFSYYELARSLKALDINDAKKKTADFSKDYSYSVISKSLVEIYKAVYDE